MSIRTYIQANVQFYLVIIVQIIPRSATFWDQMTGRNGTSRRFCSAWRFVWTRFAWRSMNNWGRNWRSFFVGMNRWGIPSFRMMVIPLGTIISSHNEKNNNLHKYWILHWYNNNSKLLIASTTFFYLLSAGNECLLWNGGRFSRRPRLPWKPSSPLPPRKLLGWS